jgi:hypothetical protein
VTPEREQDDKVLALERMMLPMTGIEDQVFYHFWHETRWEVVVNGTVWFFASRPSEAEAEAKRIRAMHEEMPIAFPLPIRVRRADVIPDGMHYRDIEGPWKD